MEQRYRFENGKIVENTNNENKRDYKSNRNYTDSRDYRINGDNINSRNNENSINTRNNISSRDIRNTRNNISNRDVRNSRNSRDDINTRCNADSRSNRRNKNDIDSKEARRRKRKIRQIKRLTVYLAGLCIFIIMGIILISKLVGFIMNTAEDEPESTYVAINSPHVYNETVLQMLTREKYPESLIDLYQRNPETKDFVIDYFNRTENKLPINIDNEIERGKIPLFIQWDERWGYENYGEDFMALTGCGPTCLSMVWCGLNCGTKWNPYEVAKFADEEGYYVDGSGSSWELMTKGAVSIGLNSYEISLWEDTIINELSQGHPIICAMGPGEFTTKGHFIVLTGLDSEGNVIINDPNSIINSNKSWKLSDIMGQIKNLWAFTL